MSLNVQYKPIGDRILIQPVEKEKINKENTIMPMYRPEGIEQPSEDKYEEQCYKGTVIATGNGTKEEPMNVKVGDVVFYEKWCGMHIEIDEEDYVILRQWNVLMKETKIEEK